MSKRNIVHIEFSARDPKEAAKFYAALFGWRMETDENINYTQWDPGTPPAGGFSPVEMGATAGQVLVYVASDDIEADLKRAAELGGTILTPKNDIPGIGWWGAFKDPTGNVCGLFTSLDPQ
jgi:predicted enzyme related to lactoylglutathione lyase